MGPYLSTPNKEKHAEDGSNSEVSRFFPRRVEKILDSEIKFLFFLLSLSDNLPELKF